MSSVMITDSNHALDSLRRSWVTAVYTEEDQIGPMGSLHEAGDALVALALLQDDGPLILGSGVMIGPGIVVVASHVLEEFRTRGTSPILLTFLKDGARAWLPCESITASGPSMFSADRRIVSDISILTCTLNSHAFEQHPLTLAPIQIALPLINDRLWAFGYRHETIQDTAALVTPLVASGLVTAVFPNGRGERMPSPCVEVKMETKGGMSGGPVVNSNGDLVGIVSSSFEGGPSYVTLFWDALRFNFKNLLPSFKHMARGDMNLFTAQSLGLVKLKGNVRRSRRGNVTMTLSDLETKLLMSLEGAEKVEEESIKSKDIAGEELEIFEDRWLSEIESTASEISMEYLKNLELSSVKNFLLLSNVPEACVAAILDFSVSDFDGIEDIELQSVRRDENGIVTIKLDFDLPSVIWSVDLPVDRYQALSDQYDESFENIEVAGSEVSAELCQHSFFEATLVLDLENEVFLQQEITFAGIVRSKQK